MAIVNIKTATMVGLFAMTPALFAGCIAPDSPLLEGASDGCDEFATSTDPAFSDVDVDPNVRAIMVAAVDFSDAAERAKVDVFTACAGIATDLGAADTWSGIEGTGPAISNASGTGACDQAAARIEALVPPGQTVGADIAIAVTRGECRLDFDRQVECDTRCTTQETCDSGTVETRCDPAKLSVVCSAECSAGATCVGTPELPANCMGACQAECVGDCHGTCFAENGEATESEGGACNGKCSASCNGKCRGLCKIEEPEGVACGADVRCTGGCTAEYTAPQCTTEFSPPDCEIDTVCFEACSAQVTAHPTCTPTKVTVYINSDSPELEPLVAALQNHLPPLLDAGERHGRLALQAGKRLVDAGADLETQIEDLNGKSLACVAASVSAVSKSVADLNIAIDSNAKLTVMLEDRTL